MGVKLRLAGPTVAEVDGSEESAGTLFTFRCEGDIAGATIQAAGYY